MNENNTDEQWSNWGKIVLNLTNRHDFVMSEKTTCPHCGQVQFHAHFFSETLECVNGGCKKRYASRVPRPVFKGETSDDTFRLALDTLFKAKKEEERLLPPLTKAEVDALGPEVRSLLARMTVQSNIGMLAKVLASAEAFAEQGT